MTVYLCGALATAVAAMGGAIRFSGLRTGQFTQVAVAVLAGAFWPVVILGALQVIGIALLVNSIAPAPAPARAPAPEADAPTSELLLAG